MKPLTHRRKIEYELEGFGIDPHQTRSMWREAIEMVVGCWTNDEFEFQGEHWSLPRRRVLLMSPQGQPLGQADLRRWAADYDQLVFLCGHYEGFDERIRPLADEEVSIGDFVLTGGELPAATIINGVVRLLPGTVGTAASLDEESHSTLLLEHPHYTRPANFREMEVPAVLRSGDHGAIARWRFDQQQQRTAERRPDLFARWQAQQQLQQ